MNKQKTILILPLLVFFALYFFSTSLAQTQETSPSLRRNEPERVQPTRMIKKAEIFQLVNPSNEPIAVTFNQCVNAAQNSCKNGVSHVDHEETTGNCSFGCLAAPSNKPKE
jgi:hypothetical protein